MTLYQQLKLEGREKIFRLQNQGRTIRAISRIIRKSPSTISRELRRNSCSIGYLPEHWLSSHRLSEEYWVFFG